VCLRQARSRRAAPTRECQSCEAPKKQCSDRPRATSSAARGRTNCGECMVESAVRNSGKGSAMRLAAAKKSLSKAAVFGSKMTSKAFWSVSNAISQPDIRDIHRRAEGPEPGEFVCATNGKAFIEPQWGYVITDNARLVEASLYPNFPPHQYAMANWQRLALGFLSKPQQRPALRTSRLASAFLGVELLPLLFRRPRQAQTAQRCRHHRRRTVGARPLCAGVHLDAANLGTG